MKKTARRMNAYVISTSGENGNFVPIRKKVFDIIEKLDMKPVGYELFDYASAPGENISGNCIKNMQSGDLFLIFINNRYGFTESDNSESVTHIEIREARKSGKPCLIFVDAKLLGFYENYTRNAGGSQKLLEEYFGSDFGSGEKLISLIQEIYNDRSGNLLIPYDDNDIQAMMSLVEAKIIGLAPDYVLDYVVRQRKVAFDIRNDNPLSSGEIEVAASYLLDGRASDGNIVDCIKNNLSSGAVVIEGESGSGKSYSLLSALVSVSDDYISSKAWSEDRIPLLLSFGKYKSNRFDMESYICSIYEELTNCHPPKFVVDRFIRQGIMIFADGLDEWAYSSSFIDISNVISEFGLCFVLSVRSIVYKRIAVNLSGLGVPCNVITVFGWNTDSLYNYALRCLGNKQKADRFLMLMRNCESKSYVSAYEEEERCYSPLISCMAIQHAAKNRYAMGDRMYSIGTIFRSASSSCLYKNMKKEKIQLTDENINEAKQYLINVARFVFIADSIDLDPTSVRDLNDYLKSINDTTDKARSTTYLSTFFTTLENSFYPKHMMVVYYYVAECALELLRKKDYSFFSEHNIPSEVNRMLGDFYAEIPLEELEENFAGLCRYAQTINDESSKLLIMYFIPRLALSSKAIKPIVVAFLNQQAEAVDASKNYSLIAVLNWLTQLGDLKAARRYLALVREKGAFSDYNRGSYLIYQGDRPGKKHGYKDLDGNPEWEATARAFIEHFQSKEVRQSFIRCIDLAVMISFLENGKTAYPFLKEYFLDMSDERLFEITFNEKYEKIIEMSKIDVDYVRSTLSLLLSELKAALRHT